MNRQQRPGNDSLKVLDVRCNHNIMERNIGMQKKDKGSKPCVSHPALQVSFDNLNTEKLRSASGDVAARVHPNASNTLMFGNESGSADSKEVIKVSGPSQAILCYTCTDGDVSCSVTTKDTQTEQCSGYCQTRVQWKFRETVRYVNITRSCVPSCYERTYLYGYFDSVEDMCCAKPSKYNKCHYCSGDGKDSCQKDDYITVSTNTYSLIYCVGQCKKVTSEGKYEGNKITSVERTCDEQCESGDEDLLDPYGDKKIGTKTTYCCTGDLCNAGTCSRSDTTWSLIAVSVAFVRQMTG
ncbi:hypothetical protein LSH36_374g01009 [Paralvinella palmiformis]|uniref:Uncharacterized protein n=1 Tax=Paralvinella palmiformis TaxID=53620 RepID=A0AAD9N0P2_9ANNE|nr:hypothetical protein LSH36_374g01009 [Paralvinella palmiformis]